MSEAQIKPTDNLATVAKEQLPAVIDDSVKLKPVYLEEIYTGQPGLIIILSERFNLLAKENAVSPDLSALEKIGFTVKIQEWSTSSRVLVTSINNKAVSDKRKAIVLESDKGRELIEDVALKGFENTLLPMVADIQAGMEKQLDIEIKRLQKIKGPSV